MERTGRGRRQEGGPLPASRRPNPPTMASLRPDPPATASCRPDPQPDNAAEARPSGLTWLAAVASSPLCPPPSDRHWSPSSNAASYIRGLRPKMTITIFIKVMGLAFLEPVMDQNLYFMGAKLTSAGFATALVNILPAVTFVLALILRMEKVRLRSLHSQAKIAGTVLTVAGAVLMVLYHGPIVQFPWTKGQHHATASGQGAGGAAAARDWLNGTIMVIIACVAWACFFILQSNTLRSYPAELSLTVLICGMGSLMSGAIALVAERANTQAWVIGFDTRLFTAVYAGIVCSGVAYYVQGIVSRQRGPVFVTAFNPLCMIITAVMGSIILKEEINLGSVIGAAIIVGGLYFLIWGKSKVEINKVSDVSVKGAGELPLTSRY